MKEFLKKVIGDKKEYRQMMARVKEMPEDYQFVFEKIQKYMWNFGSGSGYDILKIHYDLIELFEAGIAHNKHVLDITGEDVAAFCDDLLKEAQTYTEKLRQSLNKDIMKKLGKRSIS